MMKKSFFLMLSFVFLSKTGNCYVIPEQLFPNISPSHRVVTPASSMPQSIVIDESKQKAMSVQAITAINSFDEFNNFMVMSQEEKRFVVLKIDSAQATDAILRTTLFEQVATSFENQGHFAVLNLFENQDNDQLAYDLIAPLYAVQGKLLASLHSVQLPVFLIFLPDEATGMTCKNISFQHGQLSREVLCEAIKAFLPITKNQK